MTEDWTGLTAELHQLLCDWLPGCRFHSTDSSWWINNRLLTFRFTFKTFSRCFCPMRRSISTFVTRKKEQHFTASKVRMKKTETIFKASSECVSAYNLNANATHVYTRFFCFFWVFFDWGMGGSHAMLGRGEVSTKVCQLSWHWSDHWGARTEKSRDFTERPLFALSDAGTSRPVDVVEWNEMLAPGCVVWPVFRGRWVQFHWQHWRPIPSFWICLQLEASGGHGVGRPQGRIWVDWKQGVLQCSGCIATV